jgi:hypothetical protein
VIRFVTGPTRPGPALSRREWLRLGGVAGVGGLVPAARAGPSTRVLPPGWGRARSVIVVYANGGQSQFETWDPKPDAPEEVRGEFRAIATAVPGTFVCEHMPRLARLADRYAILRSLSHDDTDHGSATYLALTGRFHPQKSANPPPKPTDFPALGSVLTRLRPATDAPYTAVHINGPALVPELPGPGQDAGLLGRECDPLVLGDVTAAGGLPDLAPPPDVPTVRQESRRSLLRTIDGALREWTGDPALLAMDEQYRRAYAMLASPRCRAAFDLAAEPAALRERYGMHRSGQSCLLARRLAEAGVPLVTVIWNHSARGQDTRPDDRDACGWDTHNDIFDVMRRTLLPRFDRSFSALLEDLETRGMLDETLVVCTGEFGRAPRVAIEGKFAGSAPGRKHWANVYSIVMAGGGVRPGLVLGASDRIGGSPKAERVGPWDVAATILSALGVDPAAEFRDPLDRPFAATLGRPIAGLYPG